MRPSALFLICVSLLGFFVCCKPEPPKSPTQPVVERSSEPPALVDSSALEAPDSTQEGRAWNEECPRGTPEGLLKADSLPGKTIAWLPSSMEMHEQQGDYKIVSDSGLGVERARFRDGDSLIIEQSGCEYYAVEFCFITSQPVGKTNYLPTAVRMLRKTIPMIEAPNFFRSQTNALDQMVKAGRAKIGQEYNFGSAEEGAYNELLTVKEANALPDGRTSIRVSIAMGPL